METREEYIARLTAMQEQLMREREELMAKLQQGTQPAPRAEQAASAPEPASEPPPLIVDIAEVCDEPDPTSVRYDMPIEVEDLTERPFKTPGDP